MARRAARLLALAGAGLVFTGPRLAAPRNNPPATREVLARHQQPHTLCGSQPAPATVSSQVGLRAHYSLAGQILKEISTRNMRSAAAAGVVAALVMAVLTAVVDPLKDRILRRRVYAGCKPPQIRCFLGVSLCVQMIKFPLFEPLLVWALATKLVPFTSPLARAALAGVAFAVATLPFTNFRMAASNRSYRSRGGTLRSFVPTVARDTVYAVARVALPAVIASKCGGDMALFRTVFTACLLAAPFNELRDLSLANRKASEFFLPFKGAVFAVIRSALQAVSLVLGYRYAPIAVQQVTETLGQWHSTKVFMAHWKVLPEMQLWAVAGIGSLVMLMGCMLLTQFKRLRRSQPDILREFLMDS